MKIYIPNISLDKVKNNINKLDNYCVNKNGNIINEIYSQELGIYYIENSKIYKQEVKEEKYEMIKNYSITNKGCYDILIDNNIYEKVFIKSQLPVHYILLHNIYYEYKLNKESDLSLLVKYNFDKKVNELQINDFYFIYKENQIDLKNMFFQEEFNMFLFYLN
jgi:hypothetical protein